MKNPRVYLLLLATLSACGERISLGTAQICLGGDPFGDVVVESLEEGQLLEVFASATAGCHSEDLRVSCLVELDGDTIIVSTETTWIRTEPLAISCASMLSITNASCESSEPLPAGMYTMVYGDSPLDIEIPSDPADYDCLDGAMQ